MPNRKDRADDEQRVHADRAIERQWRAARHGSSSTLAVKAPRIFYILVLTLSWAACVLLQFAFPGPERAAQALTLTGAAFWARSLAVTGLDAGHRSIETVFAIMALASVITVLVVSVTLELVRVRRVVWVRSVLASCLCGLGWPLWKLACDVRQGYSFTSALGSLEVSRYFIDYALFCACTGLLVGSVVAVFYGGTQRLVHTTANRVGGRVSPPASHTTVHAGPRTAVPGSPCGLSSTLSLPR